MWTVGNKMMLSIYKSMLVVSIWMQINKSLSQCLYFNKQPGADIWWSGKKRDKLLQSGAIIPSKYGWRGVEETKNGKEGSFLAYHTWILVS